MNCQTIRLRKGGFSRVDLVVLVATVVLAGLWYLWARSGERGRVARCAGNLGRLGEAMRTYATDHDNGLPAAAVALAGVTNGWYMDIGRYLDPSLPEPRSAYDRKREIGAIQRWFACPADPIRRGNSCSYAMSAHDMTSENWPPGPENETGVGLSWNQRTVAALLDEDAAPGATNDPALLPQLKWTALTDPANTLLLTEYMTRDNTLASVSATCVSGVSEQRAPFNGRAPRFHFGRFNYLMADGHVELLSALLAGGMGMPVSGIWQIKKGN